MKDTNSELEKEGDVKPKEPKPKRLNFRITDYFSEMKFGMKISTVIAIVIVWIFLAIQAMNLLNTPSDIAVVAGIIIILFLFATVVSAFVVSCKKAIEVMLKED